MIRNNDEMNILSAVKLRARSGVIWIFLPVFLFFSVNLSLFGQSASTNRRGDDLTLKIAVIGPGSELYFWWGHIGLIIEDRITGDSRFFDWGVFSFENDNFFVNFAFGRLIYSCMVSTEAGNLNIYRRTNRDITIYTLDLPADKKEEVLRFAENNMLPPNRDYAYHHFRDNCATRIRDILDMAVDGQFKAAFGEAPGRFTLRQHIRRHSWFNPFFDWMLNFLMGQDIDPPITVWDEMFLPSEIGLQIRDFGYYDSDGKVRFLVSSEEIVNTSHGRPKVLSAPVSLWPGALLASLLLSELLALFYLLWERRKGFDIFLGITNSFLGLFFGIAGSMLFFMSFFTNHDYTYHNSNLLFINPLLLAAVPLGIIFTQTGNYKKRVMCARLLEALWIYVLVAGIITLALNFFGVFRQQDMVTYVLVLPLALAMILIIPRLRNNI